MNNFFGKKIGIFASGGLVAWTACKFLKESGAEVQALFADVGQEDEDQISNFLSDMERLDIPVISIDLKNDVAEMALEMIQVNAQYEGGYWNSTSALRFLLVNGFSSYFKKNNFDYYSHGSVGGGNDQRRFNKYGKRLLHSTPEIVMWEAPEFVGRFSSRKSMIDYLDPEQIYVGLDRKHHYSTDGCLLGASHEGTEFEDPDKTYTTATPVMSRYPWQANDKYTDLTLGFEKGKPTSINGTECTPLELIKMANKIGGENGLSLKSVFENRINLSKCRGVYESPGMDLLNQAQEGILFITTNFDQRKTFYVVSKQLGRLIYEGEWQSSEAERLLQEIKPIVNQINGEVRIRVYKGNVYILNIPKFENANKILHQKRFEHGGHVWNSTLIS